MEILTHYFIALLVTGVTHLLLAAFVLFKGIKNRINQTYALYSASISIWAIFEAFGITASDRTIALFLWRLNHVGVIFITIGFVHFVFSVSSISGKKKKLIPISYAIAFIFVILNCTDLLISEVVPKFSFRYFINPGLIYYVFFTLWVSWAVYGLIELFRTYSKSSGIRRNQMQYFCWSMLIAYIGGIPNFFPTFNIEIPVLMPFGTYAIPIYAFFTVYAIIKYHLMEIRVVATRTGIFAIVYALVLGIPFVIARKFNISLFSIFGLFLLIGMSLASVGPFIYQVLRKRAEAIMLRDQHRYQKVLRELAHTMIRIKNLDNLVETVDLTIYETVKVSFIAIYLKDDEYKYYRRKHCYPKEALDRFKEFIPLDDPLPKALSKEKIPLSSEEIGPYDKISLDSGLVIPCVVENNLSAFIVLGAKPNKQMYTPDDILAFETVSYSVSLAIENCLYWREIEEYQRKARIAEMDIFSYSVAHEIDNPMSIIKTCIAYLKNDWLTKINLPEDKKEDLIETLDEISSAQDRTSATVKAVEDYGKKVPTSQLLPLRLKDVIGDFLKLYLFEFKHHGIYFTQDVPAIFPYIMGIKQSLLQVLVNFSANAIHACLGAKEQQKKIHLKVELPNLDWVRISVSDNGYGIAKHRLSVIFAALATSKASSEGKGMGLYIVRKTIERHNGRVWAESEGEGKGAAFIMELPIAKGVTEDDVKKHETGNVLFLQK